MKQFIKEMDNLPLLVKLILCIPAIDIIWAVYRIVKGVVKGSIVQIIIGILWIAPGVAFAWLIDLIAILLTGKPILTDL
ncbi:MAG: hypothetical protein IKL82_05115 [Clostridia bacterium]|nr:hypothetical protein [Clostridia bacterium]